jgi:hypothetical protein
LLLVSGTSLVENDRSGHVGPHETHGMDLKAIILMHDAPVSCPEMRANRDRSSTLVLGGKFSGKSTSDQDICMHIHRTGLLLLPNADRWAV